MHRSSIALCLALALSACSSDKQLEQSVGASVFQNLKGSISQRKAAPLTTQILRARLTPESHAQIGLPALIVELPKRKLAAVVFENERNGAFTNWQALDGVGLTTRDGILVSTRGLGFDLMSTNTEGARASIIGRAKTDATRQQRYLDGEGQTVLIALKCSYSESANGSQSLVVEKCSGAGVPIQNKYWLNTRRDITKSVQWVSQRNGYMLLEGPIQP